MTSWRDEGEPYLLFTSHPAPSLAPFIIIFQIRSTHERGQDFSSEALRGSHADSSTSEASDGQWPRQASIQHRGQQHCSTGHTDTHTHTHTHTEASQCNTNTGQAAVTLRGLILLHCAAVFLWHIGFICCHSGLSDVWTRIQAETIIDQPTSRIICATITSNHTHTHSHTHSRSPPPWTERWIIE